VCVAAMVARLVRLTGGVPCDKVLPTTTGDSTETARQGGVVGHLPRRCGTGEGRNVGSATVLRSSAVAVKGSCSLRGELTEEGKKRR
jgi:hypothetical protein